MGYKKDMKIVDVDSDDHDTLSIYASVHQRSMAEVFKRAVAAFVASLDEFDQQVIEKAKAEGRANAGKKRGRRSAREQAT